MVTDIGDFADELTDEEDRALTSFWLRQTPRAMSITSAPAFDPAAIARLEAEKAARNPKKALQDLAKRKLEAATNGGVQPGVGKVKKPRKKGATGKNMPEYVFGLKMDGTLTQASEMLFFHGDKGDKGYSKLHPDSDSGGADVSLSQAGEDWFDFDNASAMKSASRGESLKDFVTSGGEDLTPSEQKRLMSSAAVLQEAASTSTTPYKRVFRGLTIEDEADLKQRFPLGKKIVMDGLTAASPKRDIASIYHNTDNFGGKAVLLHVENSRGVVGYERDKGTEIVLPHGSSYKVTRVWDEDGVTNVTLFSTEKASRAPKTASEAFFFHGTAPRPGYGKLHPNSPRLSAGQAEKAGINLETRVRSRWVKLITACEGPKTAAESFFFHGDKGAPGYAKLHPDGAGGSGVATTDPTRPTRR